MDIDEIIGQLSNLSLRADRAPTKGNLNSITYNGKGKTQDTQPPLFGRIRLEIQLHRARAHPRLLPHVLPRRWSRAAKGCCSTNEARKQSLVVTRNLASVCAGEATVQQLRSYLRKVKLHVSKATSTKKLREIAKQEAKGLLRIAQTGLKNTAGGLGE